MKRTVRLVAEEPSKRNGKARLYAYGAKAIADVAGTAVKTVVRATETGKLNPHSLESVREWTTKRKTKH